tara:strand:- start:582 stop:1367 length:786 start_codon:yes stop_codon:yes gene_type:complete
MNSSSSQIKLGHMTYINSAVFYSNLPQSKYTLHPYTPREMAKSIEENRIFAGPIPYAEIIRLGKKITPLSNIGVACKNDAKSVFVFSNISISKLKIKKKKIIIAVTSHSATSVQLLRILLRDYWSLENYEFVKEDSYHDICLVIGDPAIKLKKSGSYKFVYDLASIWKELTGLPFVFAEWVSNQSSLQESNILSENIKNSIELSNKNLEKLAHKFSGHYFDENEIVNYINNFTYILDDECRKGQLEFKKRLETLNTWHSLY